MRLKQHLKRIYAYLHLIHGEDKTVKAESSTNHVVGNSPPNLTNQLSKPHMAIVLSGPWDKKTSLGILLSKWCWMKMGFHMTSTRSPVSTPAPWRDTQIPPLLFPTLNTPLCIDLLREQCLCRYESRSSKRLVFLPDDFANRGWLSASEGFLILKCLRAITAS